MSAWKKHENADSYLDGVRAAIPLIADQIALLHRIVDTTLGSVNTLLDLGCGDGALAESVLARHAGAKAVLVDFSGPMLVRAKERFDGSGMDVTLVAADLSEPSWTEALPVAQDYDLVISGFAIHHLEDSGKRELFQEIFSLLRPGGLFLNFEHVAPASSLIRELFDDLFIDNLFAYAQMTGSATTRSDVAATYHAREDQHDNILAPVESQCQWLRKVGFVDVDCYFKILELATYGGRKPV